MSFYPSTLKHLTHYGPDLTKGMCKSLCKKQKPQRSVRGHSHTRSYPWECQNQNSRQPQRISALLDAVRFVKAYKASQWQKYTLFIHITEDLQGQRIGAERDLCPSSPCFKKAANFDSRDRGRCASPIYYPSHFAPKHQGPLETSLQAAKKLIQQTRDTLLCRLSKHISDIFSQLSNYLTLIIKITF